MDIGNPLRELGAIDSEALRIAILEQDDAAWNEDQYRLADVALPLKFTNSTIRNNTA
jgi:hypothetical protein